MAVMRGKFYVWGDGAAVHIIHGRDITDEEQEHREALLIASHGEEEGKRLAELTRVRTTPELLRTGVKEPLSIWLPSEVFYALVVRTYEERMTPEEREAYRGPTAWEKQDEKDFPGLSDG